MQLSDVNLLDLDAFERGVPHDMFEVLRREAPVYKHPEPDGPGFWVVSKYHDLKYCSKHPELFSSCRQGTLIRDPSPEELPMIQNIMINMDPPRHRRHRALINKGFTPNMVRGLRKRVKGMVSRIIDDVIEQGECDFVDDVAARLPMEVICEMMGVPEEDRRRIYELGNAMVGFDDPDFHDEDGKPKAADGFANASGEMFMYAAKLAERARAHPRDDLATALVNAEVDGEKLSDMDFNAFFLILAIAGNETTRTVTTNGMLALIENPDQWAKLRADLSLIPSAVEEILRYVPAVLNFRRTVTQDTELHGVPLKENDKLTLWYPSVNRDEDIFPDPNRFDITRHPNDHLAFGVGEHFCLGANLARMELQEVFEAVVRRLPDLQLAAAPRRLRSNFINGVKEMRVRFTPQAQAA